MRTWDTFLFFNELDILEARLIELDPVVDKFVIAEATVTHQGNPKPLYYAEHKERFAPWKDKIIHVVTDLEQDSNWGRENAQREAITRGLDGLEDDDIFLLSDVDEIPFPHEIQRAPGHVLAMRNHILAVNLIDPGWWAGTVALRGRDVPRSIQPLREYRQDMLVLKDSRGLAPVAAGWHFTWLGGPENMKAKAAAFAHAQDWAIDQLHVEKDAEHMYAEKKCFVGADRLLIQCVIDSTWPKYMQNRRGPESWYWHG